MDCLLLVDGFLLLADILSDFIEHRFGRVQLLLQVHADLFVFDGCFELFLESVVLVIQLFERKGCLFLLCFRV